MRNRLQEILNYYELTAAEFANIVGVNPSGLSHILSGKRNNLSIDTILKILDKYPGIRLDWLILGTGNMTNAETDENTLFPEDKLLFNHVEEENHSDRKISTIKEEISSMNIDEITKESIRKVVKVILIYDDDSFKELNQ